MVPTAFVQHNNKGVEFQSTKLLRCIIFYIKC